MPIRFRCQDCRSRVKVPEGSQGKQVKCPRCGRIQAVPRHQNQAANHEADGVTVHTCVGSIHRAPKRKEALVGTGVDSHDREFESGGGAPSGGRLDIPEQPSNGYSNDRQAQQPSRKERRRMAAREREARREREDAIAREEAAREQDTIAESRRQVKDLFASSHHKDFSMDDSDTAMDVDIAPTPTTPAAAAPAAAAAPQPIALRGGGQPIDQIKPEPPETAAQQHEAQHVAEEIKPTQAVAHEPEPETTTRWTLDMTGEAYPFLRVIPWVLRITALMLIGPAFKAMLVADAQGLSGVVCLLILFAGLSMVVVTWTVGEIATAVRDIALRKATG